MQHMKKTLLTAFYKQQLLNLRIKPAIGLFFLLFSLVLFQKTNAQCIGPYQGFESINSSITSSATVKTNMMAEGWQFTGSPGFTRYASDVSEAYSGLRHLFHADPNTTDAAVATPIIMTPASFSFFIKKYDVVTNYIVQFSDNGGTNWYTIPNGTNSITAFYNTISVTAVLPVLTDTYQQATITAAFPATVQGYRFKIIDSRTLGETGNIHLDDFAWTSSVASENTILIPQKGNVHCTTPYMIPIGATYTFYDQGGVSDNYSLNQSQGMVFTPTTPGTKIKVTFEQFYTRISTHNLKMYNSNNFTAPLVGTYSGNLTTSLPAPYTSTASDGSLSFIFVSDATTANTASTGFKIRVEAVGCSNPSSLAAVSTFNQVNLSWTGSGSATNYEIYRSTSATPVPVSGTTPTYTVGSAATTYSATGLTAGTTYYFWVRSVCGADKSDWTGPILGVPLCSPVTVPYLENFNGVPLGQIPTCTTKDTGSAWGANNINGNLNCNSVNTAFYTKGVTLSAGITYRLSYDFSSNLNGNADLGVSLTNGPTILAANNPSVPYYLLQTNLDFSTLQSDMVNFTVPSNGTYYVKFNLLELSDVLGGAVNIDNIRIVEENCFPPTLLTASGVTASMATLNWTAPATGDNYQYYISTSGSLPSYSVAASGTIPFGGSNSFQLSGLPASTTFYVWIRTNCSGSYSAWSDVLTFTTSAGATPVLMSTTTVTQCDYGFFDSGGSVSNYANNQDFTLIMYPSVPGTKLRVVFSSFTTEDNYDSLSIYNGNSTSAPLISSGLPAGVDFGGAPVPTCPAGSFRGTGSPGTVLSTATDGSLTFRFRSDISVVRSGWSAFVSCVLVPNISSFTPLNNNCGTATTITVTGTNLSGITSATIGGITAPIVSNTATQVVLTIPAGVKTGKIRLTNANSYGESIDSFTVQAPPPVTTDATICIGGTGVLSSSTVCGGYITPVSSINLGTINLAVVNGTTGNADRPEVSTNSAACSFTTGLGRNYVGIPFQVSATGNYIFRFTGTSGDPMGYITRSPFTPGVCSANFVVGDDDSAGSLNPRMNATLTVGVDYILYTTTYGSADMTANPNGSWTITAPSGGSVMLYENSQMQWYTVAFGGTPLPNSATNGTFNPVGVAGSGVVNNTTPITRTFYAACSANSTCRTPAIFTIVNTTPGTASANQSLCSGSAADLILTGNGAPVVMWQYNATDITFATGTIVNIPSSASTTLTSAQIGSFDGSRYYRAVITVGTCTSYSNVVTITFNKTIWNGSFWTNGNPAATKAVEFQGNYTSSGDISACSITVTSGNVVIDTGHTLTVQNGVAVNGGTLTFEDDASLYQPSNVINTPGVYSGGNTGNIRLKRDAAPMFRYDYTYWSAPVNPQVFINISPTTPTEFSYQFSPTLNNWIYFNPNNNMRPGKGYILRAPIGFNLTPGLPLVHTAEFYGIPNNGTITMPVFGGTNQLNLLGNPYPSALSAVDFITQNLIVGGTLYFWTHNTQQNAPYQYSENDYALFNLVGGTATASSTGAGNNSLPTGYIASGQGFFVEGVSSGNVTYTNAMRRAGNNTQFYRTNGEEELEKHRYWVDISDNQIGFKQVLVGYVETATNDIDRLFDAKWMDNNSIALYTKVGNTNLSILGKPLAFDINEQIPLVYKSTTAGQLKISLSNYDGLFITQNIYLEDKLLNIIHDLKVSDYTFTTIVGTFEDRFVLRYTNSALGINDPVFNENTVIVYNNSQGLFVNSGLVPMKEVSIYDVRGRLLTNKKEINATSTVFTTLPLTQQVLLVKVISQDGTVVTKRVVY
jgi:hypothetical protein